MFSIAEKQKKTILFLDSLSVTEQCDKRTSKKKKKKKLLNNANGSKFLTKKWNIVNDTSRENLMQKS